MANWGPRKRANSNHNSNPCAKTAIGFDLAANSHTTSGTTLDRIFAIAHVQMEHRSMRNGLRSKLRLQRQFKRSFPKEGNSGVGTSLDIFGQRIPCTISLATVPIGNAPSVSFIWADDLRIVYGPLKAIWAYCLRLVDSGP